MISSEIIDQCKIILSFLSIRLIINRGYLIYDPLFPDAFQFQVHLPAIRHYRPGFWKLVLSDLYAFRDNIKIASLDHFYVKANGLNFGEEFVQLNKDKINLDLLTYISRFDSLKPPKIIICSIHEAQIGDWASGFLSESSLEDIKGESVELHSS